jgi:hypothetical protein
MTKNANLALLQEIEPMKWLLSLTFLICIAADACHAEIIKIAHRSSTFGIGMSELVRTTFGGFSTAPFFPRNIESTVDTILDTGMVSNMDISPSPVSSRSAERVTTIVTPPTDFPDPPIVEVKRFIETLSFDAITFPIEFVSGTTGPITYQGGYRFPSTVSFELLDSFTVSGTYKVEGPTETIEVPFTTEYRRTSAAEDASRNLVNLVALGTNFPQTALIYQLLNGNVSAFYTPATTTIFNGVVDGQSFRANFLSTTAAITWTPVPEPSTALLSVLGLVELLNFYARRGSRGYI